jgi:hypothetical protein
MSKKKGSIVFMYIVDGKSAEVMTTGLDDAPERVKKMILTQLLNEYGVL